MLNAKGTALCDGCNLRVHPAVGGLPTELPPPSRGDAKTRCARDHASISRWARHLLPLLQKVSRIHSAVLVCACQWTKPVSKSQVTGHRSQVTGHRSQVTGQWKYLYRTVDKAGNTVAQLQVGSGCPMGSCRSRMDAHNW